MTPDMEEKQKKEEIIASSQSKWLDAHYDPVAGIYSFSQCLCLGDIHGDGETKLIVADLGTGNTDMKLKVYKGTSMMTENTLIDLPTGVVTFYMDQNHPRTPAVAVASGPFIYVYKNMRPYFKFTLPPLEINQIEEDVWKQAREEKIDIAVLHEMIEEIRSQGVPLSSRSLKFLTLDPRDMEGFASIHKYSSLKRQTVITCIGTLQKCMTDDDAVSCLVVGTESKCVYILDPEAFTVLSTITLPSVPVFLSINGLYDVEFRVVVACRNGVIYTLKRGMTNVETGIELNSHPVAMSRVGKNIVVGCMDNTLRSYSTKGKKQWTVPLKSNITAMGVMDHKQRSFKATIIALADKTVCVYRDKFLVNQIPVPDVVSAVLFGRFGREDSTLLMITKGGGMIVKMLKRTATFDEKDIGFAGAPAGQNTKLDVPKKTKLYVDQTLRERENGPVMHRQFMHDLQRLRLNTAKSYAESLERSDNPISNNSLEPLKLNAYVTGIGPVFKLTVKLQNTSQSNPVIETVIMYGYDNKLYNIRKKYCACPMLVPGVNYTFATLVDALSDKGIADVIKVFVLKQGKSVPIITASISMPVSEAAIVV